MADVISLCSYRDRRATQRAWDLAWVNLEILELDAKTVHVRSALALATETDERDRHARTLARLGAQRAGYLAEKRRMEGGR